MRNDAEIVAVVGVGLPCHHEPTGIGIGQRRQQQGVDDAEHGGASADADRERQDDDGGEAAIVSERANGVTEVGGETRSPIVPGREHWLLAAGAFATRRRQRAHARELGFDDGVGFDRRLALALRRAMQVVQVLRDFVDRLSMRRWHDAFGRETFAKPLVPIGEWLLITHVSAPRLWSAPQQTPPSVRAGWPASSCPRR